MFQQYIRDNIYLFCKKFCISSDDLPYNGETGTISFEDVSSNHGFIPHLFSVLFSSSINMEDNLSCMMVHNSYMIDRKTTGLIF